MNCCDEFGNCRQGRDCPIRINRESRYPLEPADRQVLPWVVGASVVLILVVVHLALYLGA